MGPSQNFLSEGIIDQNREYGNKVIGKYSIILAQHAHQAQLWIGTVAATFQSGGEGN